MDFADQSFEGSAIEWICVDVNGYKTVNIYKPLNSQLTSTLFRCFNIPVSILVILIAGTQTGDAIPSVEMKNIWLIGQLRTILYFCTIVRMPLASSLVVGTLILTLIWLFRVIVMIAGLWVSVFLRNTLRHKTYSQIMAAKPATSVSSLPYKRWNFRKANWKLYSLITDTPAKDLPSSDSICVIEAYQDFCYLILQDQRDLSHVAAETTTDQFGMRSAKVSTRLFSGHAKFKQDVSSCLTFLDDCLHTVEG